MLKITMFAVAATIALFVPGQTLAQMTIEVRLGPDQPPIVIAHRAVGGGFPENSLAGIEHAIDRGIDMVEIDVQITHDSQYILMHDPALTRTTNVAEVFPDGSPQRETGDPYARLYNIRDFTLEDISQLRLLDEHSRDHPVPSLEQALALTRGRLLVILELKSYEIESLAQLLETHGTDNILLFTTRDRWKLRDVMQATGAKVHTGTEVKKDAAAALDRLLDHYGPNIGLFSVFPDSLTPEFVAKAQSLGIRLDADFRDDRFSAGDTSAWQQAIDNGAGAILTPTPDAVMEILGR